MNKDYLTVKEFARELSCSTQYVYKLLQTKLQPYVVLVDGKKCIDIKALELFNEEVATNQETNLATNLATNVATSSSSNIDEELKRLNARNEDIIDELRAQLKEKDEQIKEQTQQIMELSNRITDLFENNQKLQLSYQLLLSDGKEQKSVEVDINEEVASTIEKDIKETPEETPEKKKGFFKRLFGL